MAAVLVAKSVGGNIFYGFISAVAFATILAVVAGPHAVRRVGRFPRPVCHGVQEGQGRQRLRTQGLARMTTLALGVIAVLLGIAFESRTLPSWCRWPLPSRLRPTSRCCSCRCWKDCTTRGAVIGGFLSLASSVALTVVSPSVWEATLGNPGVGIVPLHLARAVLHGDWLRRHLAVLDHRQECQRGLRARRLRGAAGALGNWLRRCGCPSGH